MTTAAKMQPTKKKVLVRIYRFQNNLRQKAVNAAGGGDDKGAPSLGADLLAAAEAEFVKMAEDYPDWVKSLIRRLYEQHGRCVDTPEQRHQIFKNLNMIAHDMKGQGGTFGYPLISYFGGSLFDVTKPHDTYTDNVVEIVKAHVDAMNAVIKGRIDGDGGAVGAELKNILTEAIDKYEVAE